MKENGYEMKRYGYPVKRYCQTMDLKDDPELIAKYRECHSKEKSWREIREGIRSVGILEMEIYIWKSHSTLTLLATQDLPTFLYYMIDPLKSWCWGAILFYPFKNSRFS